MSTTTNQVTERPVRDLLIRARDIVSRGWAQHVSARDAQGEPASWCSPHARCFCISGAVARACDEGAESVAAWRAPYAVVVGKLTDVLRQRGVQSSVQSFNDAPEQTIKEVLQLFDVAIAEAA